jgi:murein DD-endopeptidase MepM/ murein hydrolase activator NlpD
MEVELSVEGRNRVLTEKRKKIGLGLSLLFLAGALQPLSLFAAEPTLPKALEEQRKQIEKQQQAVETMQVNLTELEQKLKTSNAEQERLEAEIMAAMEKSQELQQRVSDLEERIKESDAKLRHRIGLLYLRGEVSLMEVLLDSEDFSDFIDRYRMLVLLVEKDHQLINQFEADQENLHKVRAALEAEQEKRKNKQRDLLALEEQLQRQLTGLNAQLDAKKRELSKAQTLFQKRLEVNEAEKKAIIAFYDYKKQPQFKRYTTNSGKHGTYAWPVPDSFTISSPYGMRGDEFHNGIDIAASMGTPIVAAEDGVVLYAGVADGFGHWVVLAHENGMLSVYGHMYQDGVLVKPGQEVKQGDVIAKVGNDGHSSGPHLHFALGSEVTAEGLLNHVNPLVWLQ